MRRTPLRPTLTCALFLAAVSPAAAQVVREHFGGGASHYLGRSVAFLGDFDGDGIDDYAYSGRDASLGASPPLITLRSGATGAFLAGFGSGPWAPHTLFKVGDIDGDGTPDIGFGGSGDVGIRSGATDTLLWSASVLLTLDLFDATNAGDVDQDGTIDVAVALASEVFFPGAAMVFSGVDGSVIWSVPFAGTSIARIGDANGDGIDDFALGDSQYTSAAAGLAGVLLGRVLILDGTNGALIRIHRPNPILKPRLAYGASVCRIDDVDGDGTDDLVIAAPARSGNYNDRSILDVISTSTGDQLLRLTPHNERGLGGGYGGSVVSAGDLDGDGAGDFVVGYEAFTVNQPNACFVRAFSGATGATLATVFTVGGAGNSIDIADDIDGDGAPDVVLGSPSNWTNFFPDEGRVVVASLGSRTARFCVGKINSTGQRGRIDASGSFARSANDLVLTASGLPAGTFGVFVYGSGGRLFFAPSALGDGTLCVNSPQRIPAIVSTGGGQVSLQVNSSWIPHHVWQPLRAGECRTFQFWYRDLGGAGSNTTDGIAAGFH